MYLRIKHSYLLYHNTKRQEINTYSLKRPQLTIFDLESIKSTVLRPTVLEGILCGKYLFLTLPDASQRFSG